VQKDADGLPLLIFSSFALYGIPTKSISKCKKSASPETTLYRRNSPEMQRREDLYDEVVRTYGAALGRLASAYEADPDRRRDLLQDVHLAIWNSLESFDARCSLRTWVYRVGHNVATSHVIGDRRKKSLHLISIDDIDIADQRNNAEESIERGLALDRLMALIQTLKPIERQIVLLFLEGVDAAGIAEVTGLSAGNVATRIHRIKNILINRFQGGGKS